MRAKEPITAELFKQATGLDPQDDDLERCNCPRAGESMHQQCGWDYTENLPVFMFGLRRFLPKQPEFPVKDFTLPGMTKARASRIKAAVLRHFRRET